MSVSPEMSSEHVSRKIPVHPATGFAEADGYVTTDEEVLLKILKKLGLFDKAYCYRAFHPKRIDTVLDTGTDRNDDKLDCCTLQEGEGGDEIGDGTYSLVHYMTINNSPMAKRAVFSVYDKSKLIGRAIDSDRPDERMSDTFYEFKNPQNKMGALLAVVVIEDW